MYDIVWTKQQCSLSVRLCRFYFIHITRIALQKHFHKLRLYFSTNYDYDLEHKTWLTIDIPQISQSYNGLLLVFLQSKTMSDDWRKKIGGFTEMLKTFKSLSIFLDICSLKCYHCGESLQVFGLHIVNTLTVPRLASLKYQIL